jgi:hypothetical protein
MWLDPDGVAHTVAAPDWSEVVALRVVGRGGEPDAAALLAVLDVLEERTYAEIATIPYDGARERAFVRQVPARRVVTLPDGDPAALVAQLGSVDLRWRLDHLMALRDLLDEVEDGHPDA